MPKKRVPKIDMPRVIQEDVASLWKEEVQYLREALLQEGLELPALPLTVISHFVSDMRGHVATTTVCSDGKRAYTALSEVIDGVVQEPSITRGVDWVYAFLRNRYNTERIFQWAYVWDREQEVYECFMGGLPIPSPRIDV